MADLEARLRKHIQDFHGDQNNVPTLSPYYERAVASGMGDMVRIVVEQEFGPAVTRDELAAFLTGWFDGAGIWYSATDVERLAEGLTEGFAVHHLPEGSDGG
jgi:hypothetical protein